MIPTRDAKELKTKTTLPKTFETIKNNKIGHPLFLADLMEIDGVSVGSAEALPAELLMQAPWGLLNLAGSASKQLS